MIFRRGNSRGVFKYKTKYLKEERKEDRKMISMRENSGNEAKDQDKKVRCRAQHASRSYTSRGVKILTVLGQLQLEKKIAILALKIRKLRPKHK
jgi:hypothetical protein